MQRGYPQQTFLQSASICGRNPSFIIGDPQGSKEAIRRLRRLTQIEEDYQDFWPNALFVKGSSYRGRKGDADLMRLPCVLTSHATL
jgi:hypothetical protein